MRAFIQPFVVYSRHKSEIEKYFRCFKFEVNRKRLFCTGLLQPIPEIDPYRIHIIFKTNQAPKVFIKIPRIPINTKAHMYPDGSLCLFYPKEFIWTDNTSIAKYLIPWISEWIVYYECFKTNGGIWLGPEAPHSD
jgi:hypothetical protein